MAGIRACENFTLKEMGENLVLETAQNAVLVHSGPLPVEPVEIRGYDFNSGVNYSKLLKSFYTTGFQATNLAKAVDEVNRMINKKLEPLPEDDQADCFEPGTRQKTSCTVFLGYTSNMISSGVREQIRFLAEHNMVDCIVTTGGGVEEDFIKCLAPTFLGKFSLSGRDLRDRGINRIGNLLAPNDNYVKFQEWVDPILDKMLEEQKQQGIRWTPSKIIARLGKEIDNPDSVYYWCYKNNIPVFSPAITDGSLGDMIYFRSIENPGLIIDIVEDLQRINKISSFAKNTGMIILGGGLVKHHICNANLMRNGADFSVFINTAQEFDGSDAGARPDEAISWGKIKKTADPVKVYGEASIIFPLLVAETFAKKFEKEEEN